MQGKGETPKGAQCTTTDGIARQKGVKGEQGKKQTQTQKKSSHNDLASHRGKLTVLPGLLLALLT